MQKKPKYSWNVVILSGNKQEEDVETRLDAEDSRFQRILWAVNLLTDVMLFVGKLHSAHLLTVSFCWATRRRPHKDQIVELEDEREKKRKAEEDANAAADSAELKKKKEEYEAEKKTWDDEKAELKTKIKAVEESY